MELCPWPQYYYSVLLGVLCFQDLQLGQGLRSSAEAARTTVSVLGRAEACAPREVSGEVSRAAQTQRRVGGRGSTLLEWLVKQSVPTWWCVRLASRLLMHRSLDGHQAAPSGSGAAGYLRPGICLQGREQANENQALGGGLPLIIL